MSPEELLVRRVVVCASGLIYWVGVVVQARRVRRRIGRSPNLRPRGRREKLLWLGWLMVALVWIGQPLFVGATVTTLGLALWPGLVHSVTLGMGLILVVLGYAGTLWTYAAMGDAWRIGINPKEKPVLVSRGPFRWVRHPLYSLQVAMLAGAALLLPTPLSVVALVGHYGCVRLKAHDEEAYLERVHGTSFRDYVARTGRLFPRGRPPAIDS